MSEALEREHWPTLLGATNNHLQLLINCFVLCHKHETLLLNSENDPRLYNLNRELRENPPANFDAAFFTAPEDKEALVRIAACLFSLSIKWRESISRLVTEATFPLTPHPSFDARIFTVSPIFSLISQTAPRLPRHDDELTPTLAEYHPGIRFTPAFQGDIELMHCPIGLETGTSEGFRQLRESSKLRIGISPLSATAKLRGTAELGYPPDRKSRFHITSLQNEDQELAALEAILQDCRKQDVHILVLPELRVSPAMLEVIRLFLDTQESSGVKTGRGLLLVAAGSWHFNDETAFRNNCTVFDAYGRRLWTHTKLTAYQATEDNVAKAPAAFAEFGIERNGGVEHINRGTQLQFTDTAIGRITVAICVGFCHSRPFDAIRAAAPDIVLVPSMSSSMDPLHDKANELVRLHASTFVANCGVMGKGENGSFYRLPLPNATNTLIDSGNNLLIMDLQTLQ